MPTITDTISDNIIPVEDTLNGSPDILKIILLTMNPNKIPPMPPPTEMSDDSIRNWRRISFFREPTVLLIPISHFLSFTINIIIEKVPRQPIKKDIPEETHPRNFTIFVDSVFKAITSFRSITVKSSFCAGLMLCLVRRSSSVNVFTSGINVLSVTCIYIVLINSLFTILLRYVFSGINIWLSRSLPDISTPFSSITPTI